MSIVFGTPEAAWIAKTLKVIAAKEEANEAFLRDLEGRDMRQALRQLYDDLHWARVIEDTEEIIRLKELIDYVHQTVIQQPSPTEARAQLNRWNEWATGNPAAVAVYCPGEYMPL